MFKIYHNPRCRKSRAGLEYLTSKNVDVQVIDYIKTSISVDELIDIFAKLSIKPSDMVRKQEEKFKKDFKGKNFNEDEWIRIFNEFPVPVKYFNSIFISDL